MQIITVESKQQLLDAFHVRENVFIKEQGVSAEIEHDEHDQTAIHLVGYLDKQPIGTGRIRIIDQAGKIERVSVMKDYRGNNFGQQLMIAMEQVLLKHELKKAKLNAQTHALRFYLGLGYQTTSAPFYEAGIEHVAMEKKLIK